MKHFLLFLRNCSREENSAIQKLCIIITLVTEMYTNAYSELHKVTDRLLPSFSFCHFSFLALFLFPPLSFVSYLSVTVSLKRDLCCLCPAWGYGIGFVTAVCVISNIGGLLTPFMSKTFFQRLLQFLVAMGAGTLAATGLLVLIPEVCTSYNALPMFLIGYYVS